MHTIFIKSVLLCTIIKMVILLKPKEYGTFMEENVKLRKFYPLTYLFLLIFCVEETASCLPSHPISPSSLTEPQVLAGHRVSLWKTTFPSISCG